MTSYKSSNPTQAITSMIFALAVSTLFLTSAIDTGRTTIPTAAARIA